MSTVYETFIYDHFVDNDLFMRLTCYAVCNRTDLAIFFFFTL